MDTNTNEVTKDYSPVSLIDDKYRSAMRQGQRVFRDNPSELLKLRETVTSAQESIKPHYGIYPSKSAQNRRLCASWTALNNMSYMLRLDKVEVSKQKKSFPGMDSISMVANHIAMNPPTGFKEAVQKARVGLSEFENLFPFGCPSYELINDAISKLDRVAMDLGLPRAVGQ
ncbi:MAG: hypothetical protein ACOYMG_07960 [Candidatus Methylumidiphilus sp.]